MTTRDVHLLLHSHARSSPTRRSRKIENTPTLMDNHDSTSGKDVRARRTPAGTRAGSGPGEA
ncbi:hypothetical protein QJS66_09945 [Kocuria rhizophila]|nr:hypothetical protein QJS66_09945 [Kocuria rhizophila]